MRLRAVVVLPVLAACLVPTAAAAAPGDPEPGAEPGSVPAIAWKPCPRPPKGQARLECARYRVPRSYDATGADGSVVLALTRRRATGPGTRLGSLFLNPGGPGGSGTDLPRAKQFARLGQRFDLIGFDPRGTGASTPAITCTATRTLPAAFDAASGRPTLGSAGVAAALRQGAAFARSCQDGTGSFLGDVGTAYAARDLDRLRAAVGDAQLSYLGFSYGTYLGTVYADLFPGRLRALTLDGALDPRLYGQDFLGLLRRNYRASQDALGRFLRWCARPGASCRFGGADPRGSLRRLIARLDRRPLRARGQTTNGYTVVYGLYLLLGEGRKGWPQLAALLDGFERGEPVVSNRVLLSSLGIPSANVAIECTDSAGGVTASGVRGLAAAAARIAPTFAPALVAGPPSYDGANGAVCAGWPQPAPPSDWRGDFQAQGAAPILVVGTTGDPSTPYSGAQALSRTLASGRLLTFVGEGHTAYFTSACVRDAVDGYLLTGTPPAPGTSCREAVPAAAPSSK